MLGKNLTAPSSSEKEVNCSIQVKECDMSLIEKILSSNDIEIIHFNKNFVAFDEDANSQVTLNQIRRIDEIMKKNHIENIPKSEVNIDSVELFDKGKLAVRVMDSHNYYELKSMTSEYISVAPVGILTKVWLHILRTFFRSQ